MKKLLKANQLLIICFIFVAALWTVRVFAINYAGYSYNGASNSINYNSDVVAQQNILKDWQAGYRANATVGDDSWFIKYPVDAMANNLPLGPVGQLLATILIVVYLTAFLLLYSIDRFIGIFVKDEKRRKRSLLLMTIFLAIIPGEAFYILSSPNSRNIEVGLTLFLLLQLYRFLFDKNWLKNHFKLKLTLLYILVSSLIANDPLFLYAVVVPVVLAAFALYVFSKLQSGLFWELVLFIFLATIGSYVVNFLISWILPISFAKHHSEIVSVPQFENNINLFLKFGLRTFGADVWGARFKNVRTIISMLYIFTLGLSCYFLARGYKRNKNLFYGAVGFIFLWNIFTFLVNTAVTDSTSTRYLIYAVPIEILGLLFAVVSIKTKRQYLTLLLILSAGFALLFSITTKSIAQNYHNNPDIIDSQVVNAATQNSLTKGYGNYWLAGIQTYLSDNKIHELSIDCQLGPIPRLTLNPLLSENGAFYKLHPAKSFLVYSPMYQKLSCSPSQLAPLLGQPAKVLNFGGPTGDFVAIYNYDIGSKVIIR